MEAEELPDHEKILQAIDKCITSRDHEHEKNKKILKEILEDVFSTIKERGGFFREWFQDFFFVENYYKGLKVGKPEEFEVNIILKIPLDFTTFEFEEGEPGYKKLKFFEQQSFYTSHWGKYRSLLSPLLIEGTSGFYLHKEAFRHSIERFLTRAMLNVPKIDNYTVKVLKNYRSLSLRINKQGFPEMNVSLMPVIELNCKPPYSHMKHLNWYIVPEILNNVKDNHLQWGMAFYNHENDVLTQHSYLRPVIRQLEKLRHTLEWNVISCYHIKTLFMHYAINIKDDSGLPDTHKLSGIKFFIHFLDELRDVCKFGDLEDCWVPNHNLIHADKSKFAGIVKQLTIMISEITGDPAKMAGWILTSEDWSIYKNELKAVRNVQDTEGLFKSLQMSKETEPGFSKDIITADGIPEVVPGENVASDGLEPSPFNEASKDIVGLTEEFYRVVARLRDFIDMLSRCLSALEHKSAATA